MPAARNARKAITSKPYNKPDSANLPSEYDATPSLSTASDVDRSSDFAPGTPIKDEEMPDDDEEEVDDIKPVLGEDEYLLSDAEDYGKKTKNKKGRKSAGSPTKRGRASGTPKKLGQAWTGEEDWALFQQIHPRVSKSDWKGSLRR